MKNKLSKSCRLHKLSKVNKQTKKQPFGGVLDIAKETKSNNLNITLSHKFYKILTKLIKPSTYFFEEH